VTAPIEIYTSPTCGFCFKAKRLLAAKGVTFQEIDVYAVDGAREEMVQRSGGRRTVPQIFAGGTHLGDCMEIVALDRAGKLDALLAG
jgi:glutaredoxin 3